MTYLNHTFPRRHTEPVQQPTQTRAPVNQYSGNSAYRVLHHATQQVERSARAQGGLSLRELYEVLEQTSYLTGGSYWSKGIVWWAQWLYEMDGYCREICNTVADQSVGHKRIVDFGHDRLNDDFYRWQWNSLNATENPIDLAWQIARDWQRDGDNFFQQITIGKKRNRKNREFRLRVIDPRYIYTPTTLRNPRRIDGVYLNDQLVPVGYEYAPLSARSRFEATDEERKFIPVEQMIHGFRSEYAGQVRGYPPIRAALPFIAILQEYDKLIFDSARRQIANPGFWTVPWATFVNEEIDPEMLPDADEESMQEFTVAMAKQVFDTVRWEDPDVEYRLPPNYVWNSKQHSGLDGPQIQNTRYALISRISRSIGVSPMGLSADATNQGFLASRVTTQSDHKYFAGVQHYVASVMTPIVEYYLDWKLNTSPMWRRLYSEKKGYKINMPEFEYADPLKDKQAEKLDLDMMIESPQQKIRDRGGDPERVMCEILEFRERMGPPENEQGNNEDMVELGSSDSGER